MDVINLKNEDIEEKVFILKFYLYDKNKIRKEDFRFVNMGLIVLEALLIIEHKMNFWKTKAFYTMEIHNYEAFREYWINLNCNVQSTIHFISIEEKE